MIFLSDNMENSKNNRKEKRFFFIQAENIFSNTQNVELMKQ